MFHDCLYHTYCTILGDGESGKSDLVHHHFDHQVWMFQILAKQFWFLDQSWSGLQFCSEVEFAPCDNLTCFVCSISWTSRLRIGAFKGSTSTFFCILTRWIGGHLSGDELYTCLINTWDLILNVIFVDCVCIDQKDRNYEADDNEEMMMMMMSCPCPCPYHLKRWGENTMDPTTGSYWPAR